MALGQPAVGARHLERGGAARDAEDRIGIKDASAVHRARFYGRSSAADQAARRPPSV
jgi:hypothetical protein